VFETILRAFLARFLGLLSSRQCSVAASCVDLDGPLLLERDRVPGLSYSSGTIMPAPAALWG
jgi:hypothetical protein